MQHSASKEKAEVELLKMHPDFSIRESDDFHNWAEEQPNGFSKLYMTMIMMQSLFLVLSTYIKLTKVSAKRSQLAKIKVCYKHKVNEN